ncbi:hypothetical protein BKA83DRAFT_4495436 [Pisolithus microcarpus]|nr:hypothetical protein BKA83DRAFT_4495436 [Pisolithus microcarpus]
MEGGPHAVHVQLLQPRVEGSSSHFGLQTDGLQQPSFIGMQSLQDYEQSHTSSVHVSTGGVLESYQKVLAPVLTTKLQIGSFPNTSQGKAVAGRQRLDHHSGCNLSAIPEADNSQELDTNGSNGSCEDVRDGSDLFNNSQVDRWDTEQHSEQHWSDDEQNALLSPEHPSVNKTNAQQDAHLRFFGALDASTCQSDELSPLPSLLSCYRLSHYQAQP